MSRSGDLKQPSHNGGSLDNREVPTVATRAFRRSEEGMETAGVYESDMFKVNNEALFPLASAP
jgi:hypothetical protein